MLNRAEADEVIDRLEEWLASEVEPAPWVVETSGSTGTPKRVEISRAAMINAAELSARRVGGAGRWVLALPPTYIAGINVVVRSLIAGYRPVVAGADFSAAVAEAGPGAFASMVPTQLSRLLETDLPALQSLHTILLGGGPIDPELRVRAREAGVRIVGTYGSAETCGGCIYDGHPLDGVGLAIGTDGRVRVSGPTLANGYSDPELTAECFVDGWFLTSDAGRLDNDGRLVLLGRIDDMVITGGVNVPGGAVAARLRQHGAIAGAEVVGVPDLEWGNRLVAVVSLTSEVGQPESPEALLAELRDWVASERPRSWAPRELLVIDEIPMLPNGKTDRLAVRKLVEDR